MDDLTGLTGEFYVASQLDSFCLHLANRFGRFAACEGTAGLFYGRCEAYRLARAADSAGVEATHVTQALARCEAQEVNTIGWLRTNNWSLPPGGGDYGWSPSAGRRRLAVRLYASAMDANVRTAACAAAATMPEARDIPSVMPQQQRNKVKTTPSYASSEVRGRRTDALSPPTVG